MTENAYIPPYMAEDSEATGYQKIANRFRDAGIDIEWTENGPMSNGMDMNLSFMYPTEFNFDEFTKKG